MRNVSFIALAALSVLIVIALLLPERVLGPMRLAVQNAFAPATKLFDQAGNALHKEDQGVTNINQARDEIDRLRRENAEMIVKLQLNGNLQTKIDSLQEQLSFARESPYDVIACRVISREPGTWWNKVLINRGYHDGLERDREWPVVTPRGVVGRVGQVFEYTSEVALMIDTNCRIAARIQESNADGIIIGEGHVTGEGVWQEGKPRARMKYISRGTAIEPNQLVFTSALGGVFPAGLSVGTIAEVVSTKEGNFGLYKEAIIEPSVDFSKLDELFIVRGTKTPLPPTTPAP